jgi:hypothetical protein
MKSFISETGRSQGHVQNGCQECTSTIVVSPDPCLYTSNFFSYEDSRKHRKDPDDPKPSDEGDIQIEYSP